MQFDVSFKGQSCAAKERENFGAKTVHQFLGESRLQVTLRWVSYPLWLVSLVKNCIALARHDPTNYSTWG